MTLTTAAAAGGGGGGGGGGCVSSCLMTTGTGSCWILIEVDSGELGTSIPRKESCELMTDTGVDGLGLVVGVFFFFFDFSSSFSFFRFLFRALASSVR